MKRGQVFYKIYIDKNVQNNIQFLLKQNSIIPVVTINYMDEIEPIIYSLLEKNIKCIEVTLRTSKLLLRLLNL